MTKLTRYDEHQLPCLTTDIPGIGGVIKQYNEDFRVVELPLYPASGQGTHTYFEMEKEGLTTLAAIRMIARELGRQNRDIGYAGLKDAHGITRQWLSVEHIAPQRVSDLSLSRIKILSTTQHGNKIKLGHLSGNRFDIKIRNANLAEYESAQATIHTLKKRGVPNYFGPQRFGARGDNALIGLAVLRNDYDEAIALMLGRPCDADHGDVLKARKLFDAGQLEACCKAWPTAFRSQAKVCRVLINSNGHPKKAWRAVDHTLRKLYISALQSELFNRVLARRIESVDQLFVGDVAWKHVNRACFRVEDADVEKPRCDSLEISPTGPLFGRRLTQATGIPGDIETSVLTDAKLADLEIRALDGSKLNGARRPFRVPLGNPSINSGQDNRGPFINLNFDLPPGAYATNVTREVCQTTSHHVEGD